MKKIISSLLSGAIFITTCFAGACVSVQATTTDTSYSDTLKAAGFPDSYIDSLVALHEKYPQWQFEAVDTGLDWSTVIKNESKNGVNLVPKSGDDANKSTASGAYDWFTNTWTVYDGSSWVAANSKYIEKYMDPRNFLNETDIFQFESLSYSSAQTKEGVEAILSGNFMAKNVKDTDGTTLNYADAFMEIGESTGVSPYHLASRVRQEQGTNGTSSLISGTYEGYEGYFNYFNVGAAGVGSEAVIKNGLAYAKKAGWDTRYKSLLGGAQLLAKNYIAVGQDTLYFQKFNVVNTAKLYNHQYMANVTAAYTEGRKLGQGHEDKQLAFVFRIPVYQSMPETAVTYTTSGNPNNYLKSLSVSGQTMTPSFRGSTTKYSLVVENSVESVKITAAAVASTSTVTGVGTKKLEVGTNKIKVKCKSQSGTTKTYTLTIVREAGEEAVKVPTSKTYQVGETYITGIQPGTESATVLKGMTAANTTMKVVTVSGASNTGVVATGDKLELYDKDNKKISSYTMVVYGDVNGDGTIDVLDLIKLNRHILGLESIEGCYLEAGDANRQKDGLNVLDLIYINRHILGINTIQQ
jgi:beta-N-acetylglucosaminidase